MAKNLFVGDLRDMTFADFDEFLSLDLPQDQRPREGERLEFKDDIPTDLAEWVAAFANTAGGLLLVGVAEEQGIPIAIPGVARSRSDLKTRISSMLLASVQPRPSFDIEVIALPSDQSREVGIVRVDSGTWPPYVFAKGDVHRVTMRVGDRKSSASLRDLEALFGRRGLDDPRTRPFETGDLFVEENGSRSATHLTVWVRPARPANLVLDRALELRIISALDGTPLHGGTLGSRRHDFFDLETVAPWNGLHRRLRFSRDGSMGLAQQIVDRRCQAIIVTSMANELRSVFLSARALMDTLGWGPGHLHVRATVRLGDARVIASPPEKIATPYGIGQIPESARHMLGGRITEMPSDRLIDTSELVEPSVLVADLLNEQLRVGRGAEVDVAVFAAWLREVWERTG